VVIWHSSDISPFAATRHCITPSQPAYFDGVTASGVLLYVGHATREQTQ